MEDVDAASAVVRKRIASAEGDLKVSFVFEMMNSALEIMNFVFK